MGFGMKAVSLSIARHGATLLVCTSTLTTVEGFRKAYSLLGECHMGLLVLPNREDLIEVRPRLGAGLK